MCPENIQILNMDLLERVNNLGLMEGELNYIIFGGIFFIPGLIIVYVF